MGGIVGVDVAMLNAHFCLCLARLLENSWVFSHNVKRE